MTSPSKPELEHLRKRSEFVSMRNGERMHTSAFVLQARKRDEAAGAGETIRVGYTVTKKTGNAVIRNRIKRRLREVARVCLWTNGERGHDYVLIGKPAALNTKFLSLTDDMGRALKKLHRNASKNSAKNTYKQEIKNGQ